MKLRCVQSNALAHTLSLRCKNQSYTCEGSEPSNIPFAFIFALICTHFTETCTIPWQSQYEYMSTSIFNGLCKFFFMTNARINCLHAHMTQPVRTLRVHTSFADAHKVWTKPSNVHANKCVDFIFHSMRCDYCLLVSLVKTHSVIDA